MGPATVLPLGRNRVPRDTPIALASLSEWEISVKPYVRGEDVECARKLLLSEEAKTEDFGV